MGTRNIFIFCDTTDSGPDQAARKRKIAAMVRFRSENIIYIPGACLLHQYHLAVQDGLSFVNDAISKFFTAEETGHFHHYFSALAAIANSWRDQASRTIAEWVRQYGHEKLSKQYPAQVISGRWGSVDMAESFLLARGQMKVQSVLLRVLSKFVKADKKDGKANQTVDSQGPDERCSNGVSTGDASTALAGNETLATTGETNQSHDPAGTEGDRAAYRLRLSKWYRTTFFAISSKVFWFILRVCHRARMPLRHFFHFAQKHSADRCLLKLVTGKMCSFRHDALRLVLELPRWLNESLEASGCNTLSLSMQGRLKLLGAQLAFKQIRSLDLRLLKRLDECLVCKPLAKSNTTLDLFVVHSV